MTTLIVGCGYLGRRVGRRLARRGERVWGTTRTASRTAELAAEGIEPVIVDVVRPETLGNLPSADRVLYCVGFDRAAGLPMRTVYVDGLRHALEQFADRAGRLVYASSTGVYGQDDGGWVVEDSPTVPRHESGQVVLEAEGVVRAIHPGGIIVRFAGLYGPRRIPRRDSLCRGEPIAGDPKRFVNLIHIDDAAEAAIAALDLGAAGRLYLACDDRPVERGEYAAAVADCLGAPPPRFQAPEPGSPEARREESNKRIANRRMKAELGVALAYPDITTGIPAALRAEAITSDSRPVS
jgi:nucleoside-diphosphate-sugar epimerase